MKTKFPKGFLFGSATSAHQIEGHQKNDWSAWEKLPGKIARGDTSEVASDSYNKWREDIELLKQTSQNAYRFSIEWSRIEPEEGKFDERAIDHYRQILLELKKNKISSMVTLFHFTLPIWLDKKGGFTNPEFPKFFEKFAREIASKLGDLIDLFATFNEPNVYISTGFILGNWYPGRKNDFLGVARVYKNYLKAHRLAYRAIKTSSSSPVGPVINITGLLPLKNNILDKFFVKLAKYFDYKVFIKPILDECDFIGVNYYSNKFLHLGLGMFRGGHIYKPTSWRENQQSLEMVLSDQKIWKKPIYITENGIPDEKDNVRADFIKEAFISIEKALMGKVDIKGYFYWSLLDNFEWASGYSMKFGLFTRERKIKESAKAYKQVIEDLRS